MDLRTPVARSRHVGAVVLALVLLVAAGCKPQKEGVRERLAKQWGVDTEEIAITRNSSESLQICQLGIDLKHIRESIGFIVGRGTGTKAGEPALTPRAKQVIELAVEEAGRRGDASVDSGHLLLGICAEGEGLAMGIINSLGGSAEAIRAVIH